MDAYGLVTRPWMTFSLLIGLLLLTASPAKAQAEWKTFRSSDYKFRFVYPPDWQIGIPRGANVRATIKAPGGQPVNCTIVVREAPELRKYSQREINSMVLSEPFSNEDWREMLEEKFPSLQILLNRPTKIDNQPSHLAITSLSYEVMSQTVWMKGINIITFTPGHFWHLLCGAGGRTTEEMNRAFEQWQPTLTRILSSFVFER